jgi:hypothetical protein
VELKPSSSQPFTTRQPPMIVFRLLAFMIFFIFYHFFLLGDSLVYFLCISVMPFHLLMNFD